MSAGAAMRRRNRRLALVCAGFVAGMAGLSFASAPLYRMFCQATGYGGATARADRAPDRTLDRLVTVRFNADTDPGLSWEFKSAQKELQVKLGEQTLAFYRARNLTGETIVGTATFNVTPEKAGLYFDKLQCFCFTEQLLMPGDEIISFNYDCIIDDSLRRCGDMKWNARYGYGFDLGLGGSQLSGDD